MDRLFMEHAHGAARLRRRAVTATAERVLGVPVGVALPVQRHSPRVVLAACGLEFVAVVVLAVTQSLVALAALALCAAALAVLALTNRRRVLAFTGDGVVVLVATLRRQPLAPIGSAPALTLPAARGIGAAVELPDGRWWVDRTDFGRLRRAAEVLS